MHFPLGFIASGSASGAGLTAAASPTINHTGEIVGSQTITIVTNQSGGTSFYNIDGGVTYTYTHGFPLAAGSTANAWTTRAGYSVSATASYDNTNSGF